jgi:GNAT superfamily N-acetyltransferase
MPSTKPIHIREAQTQDAGAIDKLSGELGYEATEENVHKRLGQLLSSPGHGIFVASSDSGQVIGWVHVFASHRLMVDAFADLGGMVVTESHRGYGVGNQLLQAAERWARSVGLEKLRIRSKISRKGAHMFYSSKKYETIKSQRVFEKTLS